MEKGNKNRKRKQYDPLFSQSIKDAVAKFSVSETYVRSSVKNTEKGGISDEIRKYVAERLTQYKATQKS